MPSPTKKPEAPSHLERHPLFTGHVEKCSTCKAATENPRRALCLVGTRLMLTLLKRGEAVQ